MVSKSQNYTKFYTKIIEILLESTFTFIKFKLISLTCKFYELFHKSYKNKILSYGCIIYLFKQQLIVRFFFFQIVRILQKNNL